MRSLLATIVLALFASTCSAQELFTTVEVQGRHLSIEGTDGADVIKTDWFAGKLRIRDNNGIVYTPDPLIEEISSTEIRVEMVGPVSERHFDTATFNTYGGADQVLNEIGTGNAFTLMDCFYDGGSGADVLYFTIAQQVYPFFPLCHTGTGTFTFGTNTWTWQDL